MIRALQDAQTTTSISSDDLSFFRPSTFSTSHNQWVSRSRVTARLLQFQRACLQLTETTLSAFFRSYLHSNDTRLFSRNEVDSASQQDRGHVDRQRCNWWSWFYFIQDQMRKWNLHLSFFQRCHCWREWVTRSRRTQGEPHLSPWSSFFRVCRGVLLADSFLTSVSFHTCLLFDFLLLINSHQLFRPQALPSLPFPGWWPVGTFFSSPPWNGSLAWDQRFI